MLLDLTLVIRSFQVTIKASKESLSVLGGALTTCKTLGGGGGGVFCKTKHLPELMFYSPKYPISFFTFFP
jgi:hypothetical protein